MKKTILIIGCGDIGNALGQRLVQDDYEVIGVRRHPKAISSNIKAIAADVVNSETMVNLPDADILVYAVAADTFEKSAYQQAYVEGVENVLQAYLSREQLPKRIFFISSTSVYSQQDGETVDENSVTEPSGFSGQLMLAGEQLLLNANIPATIVRFSGIYGSGRERLVEQVREGRIAAEIPVMYTNRIHREDCVHVLRWLIAQSFEHNSLESVYLASDSEPAPIYEVMHWIAQQLRIEPTQTIQSPLRRRASKRCSNQRLTDGGYRFLFPTYREGYKEVLQQAQTQSTT